MEQDIPSLGPPTHLLTVRKSTRYNITVLGMFAAAILIKYGIHGNNLTEIRNGVQQSHVSASDGGITDAGVKSHHGDEHGVYKHLKRKWSRPESHGMGTHLVGTVDDGETNVVLKAVGTVGLLEPGGHVDE